MPKPIMKIPTRQEAQTLQPGDLALDCFGEYSPVTEIFGRGEDTEGRAYVCFYTRLGNGEMSGGYKEGRLVRTTVLSARRTSHELDLIEAELLGKMEV